MLAITTIFEHIGHWIKMRQSLARFSRPESSPQIRSLADFIATTSGFSFSVHTTHIFPRPFFYGTRFRMRHMCRICLPRIPSKHPLRLTSHGIEITRGQGFINSPLAVSLPGRAILNPMPACSFGCEQNDGRRIGASATEHFRARSFRTPADDRAGMILFACAYAPA
jgi:hypothetical protein